MEIRTVEPRNTLTVRVSTPVGELPTLMGRVFGEVAAFMQRKGIPFAGMPFALYHNMDMNALDVEIGFPVAGVVAGEGRIGASTIPGGRVAWAVHVGPYETIEQTYNALLAFAQERNLKVAEWMYESYLNGPDTTPPEELRTEICMPISD